ncbi:hypothetical protein BN159_5179 [Streptomyces davaonensis JCM 4913]|uniref:Uncharacterized protein n=1 Tax=Streptomyces davaonensis (strain DSM 101723 / JCM 4913 / KCC S-0913 / 768) TaxID=1214101 RepID=K4R874_STRDJ|nr:hypothetical protein [Streptomyces davaonensis]CCK29558.1 hypothetical protein BN159_5179 [Streptomyces davaonensis JCM 4913]
MASEEERPDPARREAIERITAPLDANMPDAGDFGFEAIQRLGNPVPMLVQNDGEERLELWLEPFGQDYWLEPGEAVYVTSYGVWNDHPFETVHEPGRLTVWATSWFATVSDREGKEFLPGRRDAAHG